MDITMALKINQKIKEAEETNDYNELKALVYSEVFKERFLLMKVLLATNNYQCIERVYGDNITGCFLKCDANGNIIDKMPYKYANELMELAYSKDIKICRRIINFIIENYIQSPEEFRKENTKITL